MDIKLVLKKNGITIKEFAERIHLSRPTLDTYIRLFEMDQELPKKRYQIIFDTLFKAEVDGVSFRDELKRFENLLNRDDRLGLVELETREADLVAKIHRAMLSDLKTSDFDRSIYLFINIIISNYKRVEVFKELADYFVELNSLESNSEISDVQKRYYSYFFKMFSQLNKEPEQDEDAFLRFQNRKKEIKEQREKKINHVSELMKNDINNKLNILISEYEKNGMSISKEQLVQDLKNSLEEI